jgi:glutathione S-transferase
MKLYFSPLSCSLAARIALYEAGAEAEFVHVDRATKAMDDGGDYRTIHPLGVVPTLRLEDGELLTELAAILQYLAERFPEAGLAPVDLRGRTELRKWLSFVGTELHKGTFFPLFDRSASEAVKAYALSKVEPRLSWLADQLEGRDYLLGQFSVADAYLITTLHWCLATPVRLETWPTLKAYLKRGLARPHVARAIAEEKPLYMEDLARLGEHVPGTAGQPARISSSP